MVLERIKTKAIKELAKITGLGFNEVLSTIEQPFIKGLDADISLPCFSIAKKLNKNPNMLAKEISNKLSEKLGREFSKITAVNGYVNIYYNWEHLSCLVLRDINDELQSKTEMGNIWSLKNESKNSSSENKSLRHKKPVIVEFSSPNTNKPLHLGHIRNNCLGDAISRLLEFKGFNVLRTNLINDRGIHICKAMLGYKLFGDNLTPEKANQKPDHFIGYYYSLFNKKSGQDERLNIKAQDMLKKWELGDEKVLKLWKQLRAWALEGFMQTYNDYGVVFDVIEYESDLYKKGKQIVVEGLKKGIFHKDASGAIIARFDDLPEKVLLRADGTSVYITQDIGLAVYRKKKYDFDRMIYVVGREQELHFKQLFKILKMLGFNWANDLKHLSYGMVLLEHGKMKSREGTVIEADDFLKQIQDLAVKELEKRKALNVEQTRLNTSRSKPRNEQDTKEIEYKSKAIALAAIKFYMLKFNPKKDFVFKIEKSISFEGETGPYIQYTITRINSLLDKAVKRGIDINRLKCSSENINSLEIEIIKLLSLFKQIIDDSVKALNPSIICNYLIKLSQAFNRLYQTTPFLKADRKEMHNRLILSITVKNVLSKGLELLNIPILEEM